ISIDTIAERFHSIPSKNLVIEGAGGLMAPLNEKDFVIDLIERLQAKVILVSRNYLGSINHSLITAALCKQRILDVIGWVFNDQYLHYEEEIAAWSGYPKIASIPFAQQLNSTFVSEQALLVKAELTKHL
ncbi:MAG: ATP-dependent dethiobiotin synthetase BioD, partial [Bacteroidota bacterium]